MTNNDDDLKARFRELRSNQERDIPGFRSIVARESRQTDDADGRWRIRDGWLPGLVWATVAAAFLWFSMTDDAPIGEEPFADASSVGAPLVVGHLVVGEWNLPSDALLDFSALPGDDLLNELPEIGNLPTQGPDGAQNESFDRRIPA